jgi:N-acetylglutamate synthase-like GNAT family acetyltransferase
MASARRYQPRDLEACRSLWADLTQWHRDLYGDQTIGGDDPGRAFDAHLEEVGPERIWVAEEQGRVIGLAGMVVDGRKVELEPLSVRAGCRNAGVGRLLAQAVVAAARAEGARQVVVRPTGRNAPAIRAFHALGFDVIARVELVCDLAGDPRWHVGEDFAGRTFRI